MTYMDPLGMEVSKNFKYSNMIKNSTAYGLQRSYEKRSGLATWNALNPKNITNCIQRGQAGMHIVKW